MSFTTRLQLTGNACLKLAEVKSALLNSHKTWKIRTSFPVYRTPECHYKIQKLLYSGKLLRKKTFVNWLKIQFSWRKLLQIAYWCHQKTPQPQILRKLAQIAIKLRNSQKFIPPKVSLYTVPQNVTTVDQENFAVKIISWWPTTKNKSKRRWSMNKLVSKSTLPEVNVPSMTIASNPWLSWYLVVD